MVAGLISSAWFYFLYSPSLAGIDHAIRCLDSAKPDWHYPPFTWFNRIFRESENKLVDPYLAVIGRQKGADGHYGTRLLSLLARPFGGQPHHLWRCKIMEGVFIPIIVFDALFIIAASSREGLTASLHIFLLSFFVGLMSECWRNEGKDSMDEWMVKIARPT